MQCPIKRTFFYYSEANMQTSIQSPTNFVSQFLLAVSFSLFSLSAFSAESPSANKAATAQVSTTESVKKVVAAPVKIEMVTSKGTILLELNAEKAPISVKNFINYANSGFYDNTIFHRVIKDFMVQGGGFTLPKDAKSARGMQRKSTNAMIQNESFNGLTNDRGTIAMARTNAPHSATSQFFINHASNSFLNKGPRGIGYAVFGKVTQGMDVVDAIAQIRTAAQDVPVEVIRINSVKIIK